MSAAKWLRGGRWEYAAECLGRAADLAAAQTEALLVMRRTMPVEHFQGFREATGDASAVQAFPTQLLHIHLLGVHPEKTGALAEATENAYVLMHQNPDFEPLRELLRRVPAGEPGRRVLDAAHRLDQELFAWRKIHYGVALRYLPTEATGSGGTLGGPVPAELLPGQAVRHGPVADPAAPLRAEHRPQPLDPVPSRALPLQLTGPVGRVPSDCRVYTPPMRRIASEMPDRPSAVYPSTSPGRAVAGSS